MNIAIVTTWFPAGGGYVSKAYKEILEKEHNVFIYARGGKVMKGDPNWDAPNVTWAPRHYNGIRVSPFIKWLKKEQIDVVFFNEQRYWKPVLAAKEAGYGVGAYVDYYTQQTVPAFEIYDFLICNTKRHYSIFNWHPNAYYIPWGVDIKKYKPKLKEKKSIPTFLISAGWQPKYAGDRRGTLLALQAFKKVKGDCKLILYSQVDYNEFLPEWKNLVKNDKRIELKIGTFDPFPYGEGDVYLYPSRLDGIGLTLPEAVSSGLAAITTNNGPMNEFVLQNYNGFLIDVDKYLGRADSYYWAESICDIGHLAKLVQTYVDNPALIKEHQKNARIFALKNLDWQKNAIELLSIFEKMIRNKKPLNQTLKHFVVKLDKIMAPSYSQRLLSLMNSYFGYKLNRN